MKTSKATAKSGKPSMHKKSSVSKKKSNVKTGPTEEEIRNKAGEIFYERMARGEHGDEMQDWLEAEKILRDSLEK